MPLKLFLLGRPGCGKSSAARHIIKYTESKHWLTKRFKDFDILQKMSKEEQYSESFKQTRYKVFEGFDVLNKDIFDIALKELNEQLNNYIDDSRTNEVILIEFARDDYVAALSNLAPEVLKDAYFLCIDVDINICKERIEKRLEHPMTSDDHYISKHALQKFYRVQKFPDKSFPKSFKLDNNGTEREFIKNIINLVDNDIFK